MRRPLHARFRGNRSSVLLAGLLLAAGATDCTAPRRPVEIPSGPPADPSVVRACAEVLRAEDRRVPDDALRGGLADGRAVVRRFALRSAGRMQEARLRPEIESALGDDDPGVRAAAARALGSLADPSSAPALVRSAGDRRPEVREAVVRALGRVGTRDAVGAIADALADEDPAVRGEACEAAWKLPEIAPALDRLLAMLDEDDLGARRSCAYALARLGASGTHWKSSGPPVAEIGGDDRRRVRAALAQALLDEDAEVRMQIARGLAAPVGPSEETVLLGLARDRHPGVRVNAIRSLSYPSAPVDPALSSALGDSDPGVIRTAVEGLGRIRSADAARLLLGGLSKEKRPFVLTTAIDAVATGYPGELPSVAVRFASHEAPQVRAAVALALAGRPEPEAHELARRMLVDPAPIVRTAAIAAVGTHGGLLSETLAPVRDDPDAHVRGAVARAAAGRLDVEPPGSIEREDALDLLDAVWSSSRADTDPAVRVEALAGLGSAGDVSGVLERVRRGLDDPDRRVRLAAVRVLREVFDEDRREVLGPAADRPIDHYVEILTWAGDPHEAEFVVARAGASGRFRVDLDAAGAPLTAWNFRSLANGGFYDGLVVHRVVPNFVAQDGDPRGDGQGGPGWTIRDEPDAMPFTAGVLGMASSGRDTAGSQWFVTLSAQPHLDGRYTAFGTVSEGMESIVPSIVEGDRVVSVRVR